MSTSWSVGAGAPASWDGAPTAHRVEMRSTDAIDRMLVELGMVTPPDLNAASREAAHLARRPRDVLAAMDVVTQDQIAEAVAAATGHLRGSLAGQRPDAGLAEVFDESWSRRHQALVLRTEGRRVVVAVAEPLSAEGEDSVLRGCPDVDAVHQVVVTASELDRAQQDAYRDYYLYEALFRVGDDGLAPITVPDRAARTSRTSRILMTLACAAAVGVTLLALGVPMSPVHPIGGWALLAPVAVIAAVAVGLLVAGMMRPAAPAGRTAGRMAAAPGMMDPRFDAGLPSYTVLAFAGPDLAATSRMIDSIRALDYPASLLDIKLLCREDAPLADSLTNLVLPPQFRVVLVPTIVPDTVSGAHNYGLAMARGEYTLACRPGERPAPDRLRRAVRHAVDGWRHAPTEVLQAAGGWDLGHRSLVGSVTR